MAVSRKAWIPAALLIIVGVGALPFVLLVRGPESYGTARRLEPVPGRTVDPGPERFELSRQLLPVVKASWVPHVRTGRADRWPASVVEAYDNHARLLERGFSQETLPAEVFETYRQWRFGGPSGLGTWSQSVVSGERAYLFVSRIVREIPVKRQGGRVVSGERRFYSLAVLEDHVGQPGSERETLILDSVEGPPSLRRLPFAVATHGDEVLVVYATKDALVARRAVSTASGLELPDPVVLADLDPARQVYDVRLGRSTRRFHLLWTEAPGGDRPERSLFYAGRDAPSEWETPRLVSATANRGSANLIADGPDVFIAWADHRFRQWRGFTTVNDEKVFVVRAPREGTRHGRPVLISDREDPDDAARRLMLQVADRDLVLYWSPAYQGAWNRAVIDRELTTVTPLGERSGNAVMDAYKARLRSVLEPTTGGNGSARRYVEAD